jgi:hypothetical protein
MFDVVRLMCVCVRECVCVCHVCVSCLCVCVSCLCVSHVCECLMFVSVYQCGVWCVVFSNDPFHARSLHLISHTCTLCLCLFFSCAERNKLETLQTLGEWGTVEDMDALYVELLPRAHVLLRLAQVAPERVSSRDRAFFGRFLCLLCVCRVKDARPLSFVALTVAQWQTAVALAGGGGGGGEDRCVVIASESFKTRDTFGFDMLLFLEAEATLVSLYLDHIRPICFGDAVDAALDTTRPLLVNSKGGTAVRDFSRKLVALTQLLGLHITANRWCVRASSLFAGFSLCRSLSLPLNLLVHGKGLCLCACSLASSLFCQIGVWVFFYLSERRPLSLSLLFDCIL